jgi:hypothetical protein
MKVDRKRGVMWNNVRLMPGSHALELYEGNKLRLLENHMTKLDAEADARGDVPVLPTSRQFQQFVAGGLRRGEVSIIPLRPAQYKSNLLLMLAQQQQRGRRIVRDADSQG